MRKTVIGMIAATALSGCASVGGNQTDPVVTQAQTIAVQVCGFLPAIETVIGLFSSSGYVASAAQIADAICAAVTAKSVRRGGSRPVVGGVVINGRFVR